MTEERRNVEESVVAYFKILAQKLLQKITKTTKPSSMIFVNTLNIKKRAPTGRYRLSQISGSSAAYRTIPACGSGIFINVFRPNVKPAHLPIQ
jgi:hypothetical protein